MFIVHHSSAEVSLLLVLLLWNPCILQFDLEHLHFDLQYNAVVTARVLVGRSIDLT